MAFSAIDSVTSPFPATDADAALLIVAELSAESDPALDSYPGLFDALRGIGFSGTAGSFARVYLPELSHVTLAVAGAGDNPSAETVRDAAGVGSRQLTGIDTLAIGLTRDTEQFAADATEGAVLGSYTFAGYKKVGQKSRASRILIHSDGLAPEVLTRADILGDALATAKDLVNTPAQWLGPDDLAASARNQLEPLGVHVDIYDNARLETEGWGGVLGIAQGSERDPRVVRLSYRASATDPTVALVGKGITFDTGGLSLKSPRGMIGMKFDMAGAATVLALIKAAARMRLPVSLTGWLCITDNMPSGGALRPGDVLRMLDGSSVEVTNTDAEGRIVLADGITAASREYPDAIVDVATLTGSVVAALGSRHTGVMGDDALVGNYLRAAGSVAEDAWSLPLPSYMASELDSPIADMRNSKTPDTAGGALFAGLFLQRFVGATSEQEGAPRIPWLHLDIAGSAELKGTPYGYTDRGATGVPIRSLLAFIAGISQAPLHPAAEEEK